ncbi:sarcosine oxidase subunit delta [Candidatus Pantoea multigeneris]|uniref:Sarcosine oxidase subunit delta n=1 Tax=Candidatus Pantoea multigeneris TaxID=2608357 RepID=A0ABX0R4R8_9GAMM|nr:sarcosine oxidase subunit delta [Pantoea multigeneris]NIF20407.1 sarcosine oxidase subunit delta [Pantoea multigeneris]
MFHIYCPCCGEYREEEEFHAKGQAHIERPKSPENCSDEEWGNYLFFRKNPRGIHHELWVHAAGCRKYFNMTRNTQTYEILETYKIGEQPSHTQHSDVVELPRQKETAVKQPEQDKALVGGNV